MAVNTEGVPVSRQDSDEKEALDHLEKTRSASLENIQQQQQQHAYDDPVEARRITRKIDYRLVPMLMAMYTLTFLDRVNIGNARLWNLEEDLGMSGYDYNIVVLGTSNPPDPSSNPEPSTLTSTLPQSSISPTSSSRSRPTCCSAAFSPGTTSRA